MLSCDQLIILSFYNNCLTSKRSLSLNSMEHEYLRPHSFRHTIIRWAEKKSPKILNATRQSLGHSSIDTTLQSYGALAPIEQGRIIKNHNH